MLRINQTFRLYLANANTDSQNMLVTGVVDGNYKYYVDGRFGYIGLPPSGSMSVVLNAYCVDFERDHPSSDDS